MSKHTPGPWRTFNGTDIFPDDADKNGTRYIADCGMAGLTDNIDYNERMANAKLIAAAPQMLEALKAFVGLESDARLMEARYGIEMTDEVKNAFKLMNIAIAAAEGREG